jgi:hypothetical protein
MAPSPLPAADNWAAAVRHSIDNPSHILGPYTDEDGIVQMECVGDGDPYEPNCDFDTGNAGALPDHGRHRRRLQDQPAHRTPMGQP